MFDFIFSLFAPFQHEFMLQAAVVSVLVGLVCGTLSSFITLKGWSLLGDAVSHAVLPGVAIAHLLGLPPAVGAFTTGMGAALLIGVVKARSRVKEDTVIGTVFTTFLALGVVLISRAPEAHKLTHLLFGNVLGISRNDLYLTALVAGVVLFVLAVLWRDFMLFCFDPSHAHVVGLRTTLLYYLLLSLLALTIVAAIQTVGVLLVVAMLIMPGAMAYLLTDRFSRMVFLAAGGAVFSALAGTLLSYHLDTATGATCVLVQATLFLFALFLGPVHGLLPRWWRTRRPTPP